MLDIPAGASLCDSAAQSSHTVVSSARCQCGRRWQCAECRRYWVSRRARTSSAWLQQSVDDGGVAWSALLTIPTAGEWPGETSELWRRWRAMGQQRTRELRRKNGKTGLVGIRCGIAALHVVNRVRQWQPHLHAVIVQDPQSDVKAIIDAWQVLGLGFADVTRAKSLGACVRYAIAGGLPTSEKDRAALALMLAGQRVVRRIGK